MLEGERRVGFCRVLLTYPIQSLLIILPTCPLNSMQEFVGNLDVKRILTEWLSRWYNESSVGLPKYAIIFGTSGNGKTFLPTVLSEQLNVSLTQLCPFDIESINDIYDFVKSVNNMALDGTKHKLILIDDIDNFSEKYKKHLVELGKITVFPIIYTSSIYKPVGNDELNGMLIDGSLKQLIVDAKGNVVRKKLLKLEKPLPSELIKYLKTCIEEMNVVVSDDVLKTIAEQSISVRSAMLSLYNSSINNLTSPIQTNYEFLKTINNRKLTEPITRDNVGFIFRSIRGYDVDSLKVKSVFADIDYRIRVRHENNEEIDPFFVNEMIEPIEKIKLKYQFNEKKKEKKEQPIVVEHKREELKQPTIDSWMSV